MMLLLEHGAITGSTVIKQFIFFYEKIVIPKLYKSTILMGTRKSGSDYRNYIKKIFIIRNMFIG